MRIGAGAAALAVIAVIAALGGGCSSERMCPMGTMPFRGLCARPCRDVPGAICGEDGAVLSDAAAEGGGGDAAPVDVAVGCDAGFHACGAVCADDRSPMSCGRACTPCPAPAGAVATCAEGVCGVACREGWEMAPGGGCELQPPRQIAPLSTATVTSQRPVFRWEATPGLEGARVEICRERACTTVVQSIDATGASATAMSELSAGVWFWRLRGRAGGAVGSRTGPVWQFTVGRRSAPVASSWGSTLDVNGDGYRDVVVGSPATSRAYVFHGHPAGIETRARGEINGTGGANFGWSVASAGDVNGDGFGDVVVGKPSFGEWPGRAFVFHGSADGLLPYPATVIDGTDGSGPDFLFTLDTAGDLNGDGYCDMVVGAPGDTGEDGRVYIFFGSSTGISDSSSLVIAGPTGAGGNFGWSVAGVGDANGDGHADIAVGAPSIGGHAGQLFLYLGSPSGLRISEAMSILGMEGSNGGLGSAVVALGDINGDGLADLAVSEPGAISETGRVHIYRGRADGQILTDPVTLRGVSGTERHYGFAASGGGDADGDGFDDIAVASLPASGPGMVRIYSGRMLNSMSTPFATLPGASGSTFGYRVGGLGDINGDTLADIAIGVPTAEMAEGRAYVHSSNGSGFESPPRVLREPIRGQRWFGFGLALLLPDARVRRPAVQVRIRARSG